MVKDDDSPTLHHKLLGETARIGWKELEPLFAVGQVVRIAAELDLVAVAEAVARDDKASIKQWMNQDAFGLLDDATALRWSNDANAPLWAVVVRPWVIVQERADTDSSATPAEDDGRAG